MRNLKKVLALVLAMMMTLSLMVTANAATYTDAASISKTTAVDVMSALEVFNGTDGGKFDPTGTLTRAQAAKIITYLVLGKDNAETYLDNSVAPTQFKDVKANLWYTGSVSYLADLGLVSGSGGYFRPQDKVTGYEFAKMLLTAIGYNSKIEKFEGTSTWELNVGVMAKGLGMNTNVSYSRAYLTREEACQMAYNMLTVAKVEYDKDGRRSEVALNNVKQSLANTVFSMATSTGRVTTIGETTKVGSNTYAIASDPSLLGHNVTVYYSTETKKDGNPVAYTIVDHSTTVTLTGNETNMRNDLAKAMDVNVNTITAGEWYKVTSYDSAKVSNPGATLSTLPAAGSVAILDADANGALQITGIAVPTVYTIDKVASINKDGFVKLAGTAQLTKDTTGSVYAGIAKDDIVVRYNIGTKYYISKAETVEGTLSAFNNNTITLGGVTYSFLKSEVAGLKNVTTSTELNFTNTYTLYLDGNGSCAIVLKQGQAAATSYVYFVKGYSNLVPGNYGSQTAYYAQCVDSNGETVTLQTKASMANATAGVYTATKDNDGYDVLTKATTGIVEKTLDAKLATGVKIADNHYYSDVKFIYVTGELDKLAVTVKDGAQALDKDTKVIYTIEGEGTNKTVKTVFVMAAYKEPIVFSTSIMFGLETADSTSFAPYTVNGETKTGYQHTVYIDGEKTTIITASAAKINGFQSFAVNGDLYTVEAVTDTDANVKNATKVTGMFNGLISTKDVTDMPVAGATVVNMTDNESVTSDPTALTSEYTVALVLNADKNAVVAIYVTDYTPAEA